LLLLTLQPARGLTAIWKTDIPVQLVRTASQITDLQPPDFIISAIAQLYRLGIPLEAGNFPPELYDDLATVLLGSLDFRDKHIDVGFSAIAELMDHSMSANFVPEWPN
jgi:hypothetical protein